MPSLDYSLTIGRILVLVKFKQQTLLQGACTNWLVAGTLFKIFQAILCLYNTKYHLEQLKNGPLWKILPYLDKLRKNSLATCFMPKIFTPFLSNPINNCGVSQLVLLLQKAKQRVVMQFLRANIIDFATTRWMMCI